MSTKYIQFITMALLFPFYCVGQTYYDRFESLFSARQPSARAEALGKGSVAVGEGVFSTFYNPALLAEFRGLHVGGSKAGPYYFATKASFDFEGAAYHVENLGTIGISRFHYTMGEDFERRNENNEYLGIIRPSYSLMTLCLASDLLQLVSLGLNINYLAQNYINSPDAIGGPDTEFKALWFDIGAIKRIELPEIQSANHSLCLGMNVKNFPGVGMKYDATVISSLSKLTVTEPLAVQLNVGLSYEIAFIPPAGQAALQPFKALLTMEYQDFLNYRYRSGVRGGVEIKFFEILAIRAGYYDESLDAYGSTSNKSSLSSATYGLGLSAPVDKLTNGSVPLRLSLDIAKLKQPSYSNNPLYSNWEDFTSTSFTASYQF